MAEWPTAMLGHLADPDPGAFAIGPFGSRMKADCYVANGVPVIRGTNISGDRAWKGDWVYVSEEFVDTMPNCSVRENDLVFPHRGSIGEVAIIPSDRPRYMLSTSLMKFRADGRKANPLFLFYYFRSANGRAEILKYSSQVGTPGIGQPLTSLRQFEVPLPPLTTQADIANLLALLDDKIELNRRLNETLEAMARAIFKDWFVDFGPTRAKMLGGDPYLAPPTWDLFPDELDDEDKPAGWQFGRLSDVADSPRRGISPADTSETTPYIGLEHVPRRSIALSEWEGAEKVTSNKSVFKKGECLFGKLRPYFHKVGVAPVDGICSTDIVVVAPRKTHWSAFVLACISTDEFVAYTDQTSTGTKMPRTSWTTMSQYELCLPSELAACAFQATVQPMIDRIVGNIHENRTLAQTRDLLLPKLMSGEIRLREAERAVEAVA